MVNLGKKNVPRLYKRQNLWRIFSSLGNSAVIDSIAAFKITAYSKSIISG